MARGALSGATTVAAVIGHPVGHSRSPAIHNAAFAALGLDWAFVAFDVVPGAGGDAMAAMRTLALGGLSVTMPHKAAAFAAVDRCSHEAEVLGAVNCVVAHGADLVGENTDGAGFVDSLRLDHGVEPSGMEVVVLGAGGAARAIVLALAGAGAARIGIANRGAARAQQAVALAGSVGRVVPPEAAAGAGLVVNATPVGMGRDGGLALDPSWLAPGQVVVDIVVDPLDTPLLQAARQRGATPVDGLGMLVHQAAHALRLWTGEDPPLAAMAAAARVGAG